MGRKKRTERRINVIACMFAPLITARLEREKEQRKCDKAERDARAKREKRALIKLATSLPTESYK